MGAEDTGSLGSLNKQQGDESGMEQGWLLGLQEKLGSQQRQKSCEAAVREGVMAESLQPYQRTSVCSLRST